MKYIFVCLFFVFALPVQAAVTINEVAWMGTAGSANDEWVELYNNGTSEVSLDGWTLSDGMSLEIPLAGSLAGGAYAVLERTDDASAPGSAFLIYTGALTNTGATLSLYQADGSLGDRIFGGEGWENIGGDNVTKETAQYTSAGWITARATPGQPSAADEVTPEEEEEEEEVPVRVSDTEKNNQSTQTLHLDPRTPITTISAPTQVYENQTIMLEAQTAGLAKGVLQSLSHAWNFGDTYTASGESVIHHFQHPGEYVVTLHSAYKDYEATDRQRIVVLPVALSLQRNAHGHLLVHNDARYEMDISGYRLMGDQTFYFPQRSIMLPGATIVVPEEHIQLRDGRAVSLVDVQGAVVASFGYEAPAPAPQKAYPIDTQSTAVRTQREVLPANPMPAGFSFSASSSEPAVVRTAAVATSTQVAAVIEATAASENNWPYWALLSLIGLGVLAVFAGRVPHDV